MKKRYITVGGETLSLKQWAEKLGVSPSVIHVRLSAGWTEAEAVGAVKRPRALAGERRKKARAIVQGGG